MSESSRLPELFTWGCSAIEIGFLADERDYLYMLRECVARGMQMAIHSPVYQDGNRLGLLQNDAGAWAELERDLSVARRDGLAYLLVHLQCLQTPVEDDALTSIKSAALKMAALSREYGVPVVLEPKLEPNRGHSLFLLLHSLPLPELESWGLAWCVDVGDIYMASQESSVPYLEMISHLAPLAKVVHLHDVVVQGERYFWTPVTGQDAVPIAETLALLNPLERDIFVVVEHTPHLVESVKQVRQGIEWLRGQLGKSVIEEGE